MINYKQKANEHHDKWVNPRSFSVGDVVLRKISATGHSTATHLDICKQRSDVVLVNRRRGPWFHLVTLIHFLSYNKIVFNKRNHSVLGTSLREIVRGDDPSESWSIEIPSAAVIFKTWFLP